MDFDELEALRRFLEEITRDHFDALTKYVARPGFSHRPRGTSLSKASTATCVLSLVAAGKWEKGAWADHRADLINHLIDSDWTSAGLDKYNPFTVAWILEVLVALSAVPPAPKLTAGRRTRVAFAERKLLGALKDGGVTMGGDYPASAYLTQLAVRVLRSRFMLTSKQRPAIRRWACREIEHQLALMASKAKTGDVYSLAYSAILIASCSDGAHLKPDEKRLQQIALKTFFSCQLPDGTWPPSRPLFHYRSVGNAYCFEYEMLVQLLSEPKLEEDLLEYLPNLRDAAFGTRSSAFLLENGVRAWASGHHPQIESPESWSTASVYHFAFALDRLVAEATRREIFRGMDVAYRLPIRSKKKESEFAPDFLDCEIRIDGCERSLRSTLWERLVRPIAAVTDLIAQGQRPPDDTPTSAIFFGPPGTSKTQLAREIADFLGWPLLPLDPSYLVKGGMDQVQAEANRVFSMLASAERIVVLFDEFDELVREREGAAEAISRFLTTAMLPKLSVVNSRKRIVFLLATNHIDKLDFAISRPGRFDAILQVLPPTFEAKVKQWPELSRRLRTLKVTVSKHVRSRIAGLTFTECRAALKALAAASTSQEAIAAIDAAHARCTMESPADDTDTWGARCKAQQKYVR